MSKEYDFIMDREQVKRLAEGINALRLHVPPEIADNIAGLAFAALVSVHQGTDSENARLKTECMVRHCFNKSDEGGGHWIFTDEIKVQWICHPCFVALTQHSASLANRMNMIRRMV